MDKKTIWITLILATAIIGAFVIYRFFFEKPVVIKSEVGRDEGNAGPIIQPPIVIVPKPGEDASTLPIVDFSLPNYKSGQGQSMHQLLNQDKKIFLVVWWSSCGYCQAELPRIKELQNKMATSSDKVLVLITVDKRLSTPTDTMKNAGLWEGANTYHLSDPNGTVVRDVLKVTGYPFHALITKQKKQTEISINDLIAAA